LAKGINFFHIENWYSIHSVIRTTLKLLSGAPSAFTLLDQHRYVRAQAAPTAASKI
jgi:hypothetical protein